MSTITNHMCRGKTIVDRLKYWGKTNPDTAAFIFWSSAGRQVITRGDVLRLSGRFAYRLVEVGVKPGDVVCVALPNSPQRLVAEYGIHLAGATSLNGQLLRADGKDLIESMIKAKCTSIVLDPDLTNNAWSIIKRASDGYCEYDHHAEYQSQIIPLLKNVFFCRASGKGNSLLGTLSSSKTFTYDEGKPEDTATIFTTSGSTGYSKLVPHTHENILAFGLSVSHILNLDPGSSYLCNSPFGWIGGFPSAFLFSGCTRIVIDESNGAASDVPNLLWDIICKEKVYSALMLPLVVSAVNDIRKKSASFKDQHKLQIIFIGGQPIRKEIVDIVKELAEEISVIYGSSECGLVCNFQGTMGTAEEFQDYMIGYPMTGVSVKVVDEDLDVVSPLVRGEIVVQSPILCDGYVGGDITSQNSFLPDGWFRTGDIGYMREDGCLFVEGRSSDAITHGGYILYPSWLEKVLIKCPGVKDVIIVPVPDKVLHHEICACVQLDADAGVSPSSEDIINFCQNQIILDKSSSLNVVPKYVVFVEVIPKTKTGKIDRKRLTHTAKNELNL